ncbi:MAG TPA: hypothetical protein VIC82_02605 [Candidatus Nanopelagicales bacterium]
MPGPDPSGRPDAASIVAALRSIDGVAQAQVVGALGDGSAVLRLTLTAGADEVAVATSVDAVLRQVFGLRLDPARIELVEESVPAAPVRAGSPRTGSPRLGSPPAGSPRLGSSGLGSPAEGPTTREPAGRVTAPTASALAAAGSTTVAIGPTAAVQARRPVIARAVVSSDGVRVRSEVVLHWSGHEHSGVAEVAGTAVHRAVVLSTLRALESILGPGSPVQLTVVSIAIQALDDATVALVRLRLRTATGTDWLVGSAEVHADAAQSLVRATLNALNRRLVPLFGTA